MVIQGVLVREFLIIFCGNELCMGLIFSVWFVAIFLGALLGGVLVNLRTPALCSFVGLQCCLSAFPFLQIFLIRNLRTFLHVLPGEAISWMAMAGSILVILFPLTLLIGIMFPFATKTYEPVLSEASQSIGSVYLWESVGSIMGGVVLTLCLINGCAHYTIISLMSGLLLLNAFMLVRYLQDQRVRRTVGTFVLVLITGWVGIGSLKGWEKWEQKTAYQRWRTINPRITLAESADSRHQNIAVGTWQGQVSIYGNGQHIMSFPDPTQSALTAHFLLTQHPRPETILLIGGGVEGVLAEMLKHPVKNIHYVELDSALLSIIRKYMPPAQKRALADERVRIFSADGRYYVKHAVTRYDIVIINTPDPSTAMLNRFYTVEFYQELKQILCPDGIVVARLGSMENYVGPDAARYLGAVYHSLRTVFSQVLATPGDYTYLLASDSPDIITADVNTLAQRFRERTITSPYFSEEYFFMLLEPDRVAFINDALNSATVSFLNTDDRPITYFYNLILWDLFSRGTGKTFFKALSGLSWKWFMPALFLFIGMSARYLWKRSPGASYERLRFASLSAIFTTGFASISLAIILVFSFQHTYGYLYQYLGMIVAGFMAGLALGAALMNTLNRRLPQYALPFLLTMEGAVAVFCMLLPGMLKLASLAHHRADLFIRFSETGVTTLVTFLFLVLAAGILTGMEFPLVTGILIAKGGTSGLVAGIVDGLDHGGAALGALLTGTLLVPLLGISQSCLIIAAFKVCSAAFTALVLWRERYG